eukprot:634452-Prymnesium_polylepis.1
MCVSAERNRYRTARGAHERAYPIHTKSPSRLHYRLSKSHAARLRRARRDANVAASNMVVMHFVRMQFSRTTNAW